MENKLHNISVYGECFKCVAYQRTNDQIILVVKRDDVQENVIRVNDMEEDRLKYTCDSEQNEDGQRIVDYSKVRK